MAVDGYGTALKSDTDMIRHKEVNLTSHQHRENRRQSTGPRQWLQELEIRMRHYHRRREWWLQLPRRLWLQLP